MINLISNFIEHGAKPMDVRNFVIDGEQWETKLYKGENAKKVNTNVKMLQKSSEVLKALI